MLQIVSWCGSSAAAEVVIYFFARRLEAAPQPITASSRALSKSIGKRCVAAQPSGTGAGTGGRNTPPLHLGMRFPPPPFNRQTLCELCELACLSLCPLHIFIHPELPWPHRLSSVSSIPFSSLHVDNVRSTYRDIIAARILTRPNLRPSPPGSRLRLVGSVSRLHSSPSRAAFASSSHRCQAAYAALLRGLGGELCFEPYIYIGSPFWAQHTPPVSPTARASVDRHGVQPRHLRRGNVHQQACPRRVCR